MTKPWTMAHVLMTLDAMMTQAIDGARFFLFFFGGPALVLYLVAESFVKWEWDWDEESAWLSSLSVTATLLYTLFIILLSSPLWFLSILAGILIIFVNSFVLVGSQLENSVPSETG